eukprot:5333314-Pyramimonas_sp.AAC.2
MKTTEFRRLTGRICVETGGYGRRREGNAFRCVNDRSVTRGVVHGGYIRQGSRTSSKHKGQKGEAQSA